MAHPLNVSTNLSGARAFMQLASTHTKRSKQRPKGVAMGKAFRTAAPSLTETATEDSGVLSGRYWGELRTFLAIAKARSLNRAAQELGVSRMTAARDLKRLQDAIGAQLVVFDRTGAGLTGRGQELARGLEKLDLEIYTLTNNLRTEMRGAEGMVRLSVPDGIGITFVVPGLKRLSEVYPRIRVEMKTPRNYLSLIENQTDIMVGFAKEDHRDLTSVRMGTFHFRPLVSRDYVERRGMPTLDNIDRHHFVDSAHYSTKAETWRPWRSLVERGYVSHRCDASLAYGMTVKMGLGVGLLGSFNIMEPVLLPLDLNCAISFPLFLTAATERLHAKPVQIVFDFVQSLLGADNPWFAADMKREESLGTSFDEAYQASFNL